MNRSGDRPHRSESFVNATLRREPHLWALFRQRLRARLGKHLKAVPHQQS